MMMKINQTQKIKPLEHVACIVAIKLAVVDQTLVQLHNRRRAISRSRGDHLSCSVDLEKDHCRSIKR